MGTRRNDKRYQVKSVTSIKGAMVSSVLVWMSPICIGSSGSTGRSRVNPPYTTSRQRKVPTLRASHHMREGTYLQASPFLHSSTSIHWVLMPSLCLVRLGASPSLRRRTAWYTSKYSRYRHGYLYRYARYLGPAGPRPTCLLCCLAMSQTPRRP